MRKINLILPLILLAHVSPLVLLRFTAWPEMTLWPYLALAGWLPYKDIAMAHNPLLIFDLAIFYKIFGLSLLNLKIYTWLLIFVTDLLVYFVCEKLTKSKVAALLSLGFYVLWQPYFEGNGLWFDLALTPYALLIFLFLWQKDFFWAGILFGLAFLTKQTAFWFIFPVIFTCLFCQREKLRPSGKFFSGLVIPLSIFFLYLLASGSLQDFFFWSIRFGSFYLSKAPGQVELPALRQMLFLPVPFALALFAVAILIQRKKVIAIHRDHMTSLLLFCFFGSLGVLPRWSLFHFQPGLPFLAIISGVVLFPLWKLTASRKNRPWFWLFLFLMVVATAYLQARFYRLNFGRPPRFFEKETLEMASWLKKNTRKAETIFILNSWDHLYALSETLPASRPWVPTLPWYMDYPGIQKNIVDDLKNQKPRIIVFEDYKEKGLGSYRPEGIDNFLKENYSFKGTVADRFQVLTPK